MLRPACRPDHRAGRAAGRFAVVALLVVVGPFGGLATAGIAGAQTTTEDGVTTTVADGTVTTAPRAATDGSGRPATTDESTAADDPAQDRLRLIIFGLIGLAVVIAIITVVFWRVTSPSRVVTVEELDEHDEHDGADGADLDEGPSLEPAGRPRLPAAPTADPFAAALMAPTAPLPRPTESPSAEPSSPPPPRPLATEPAPSTPSAPQRERPPVVVADPVEWPDAEPDRLDLREPRPAPRHDPPTAEQEAVPGSTPAPDDDAPPPPTWSQWQGIRPLGPVERGDS